MAKFGSMQLRNMVSVGMTTAKTVRLWMRSEIPGNHEIEVASLDSSNDTTRVETTIPPENQTDNTHSVLYPDDFSGLPPLKPLTRYRYRVTRMGEGAHVGEGSFETAPEKPDRTPEKVSVAVMSCHQPFNSDGELSERSMRMLRLLPRVLSEHDVKFIFMTGDQIYADLPENFSLLNPHYTSTKVLPGKASIFDWSQDEVRRAYQERYRIFWSMEEVKHFQANYPCYSILDDHEIRDDWGSNRKHSRRKYKNLFQGARQAYLDYQGSRIYGYSNQLPKSFHYHFTYGNVAVFVMDVRSERKAGRGHQVYSEAQFNDFDAFLEENGDKRVLFVVTSIPIVHIPSWLANVGAALVGDELDFPDHWSYKRNRPARDRLLARLYNHQEEHPDQRVVLVSGDVHMGCVFGIQWREGSKRTLYQFTASAISNRLKKLHAYFAKIPPHLVESISCKGGTPSADVSLLEAVEGSNDNNPFGGLNVGIIEIRDAGNHSTLNLKLVGYPPVEQWNPVVMFGTGEL